MSAPQSPPSPQKFVRCPGCREQLSVRPEDVGRRARCTKCGKVFLIGGGSDVPISANAAASQLGPVAALPPEPDEPTIVTFECSLCQTRMSARVADVGRMAACPDCGRRNKIPPPPKPKKAKPPAALSGEQFDLWGVDDSPWLAAAEQPVLIPVECRVCQTLMYATEAQIGAELKCPDCGAATKVAKPKPKKPGGIVPVLAGEDYELDPASAPAPRHTPVPVSLRDAELHEHARATTVGPDGRLIVKKEEHHERPVRPAVPLVTGVWRMLFTEEIITRWVLLSIVLGAAGWVAHDSALSPAGGLGGFIGIILMVATVALTSLWVTMAAPLFLAMVAESSDGSDRVHDPPQWTFFDWFAESAYLVNSGVIAGLMGLLAWRGTGLAALGGAVPDEARVLLVAAMFLLFFPVFLLGALLESSPFGILSPRLAFTLVRCPGPWLLFYVESAIIAAAACGAAWAFVEFTAYGAFVLPLIATAAMLLYMRLLGRLAWWLAETLPGEEDAPAGDESSAAHPHLAAARSAARAEDHEK